MANKKITLKKRTGSTYDVLFPETKVVNILKNDGNPLSIFGQSVLSTQIAQNTESQNTVGFAASLTSTAEPSIDMHLSSLTQEEVRQYFQIAKSDHEHAISSITGLQTALDGKVPLVGSKIPEQYFPAVNAESMTFRGTASGATLSENAVTLSTAFGWNLQSAFLPNLLDANGDPKPNILGDYVIVSGAAGYFTNNAPTTVSGKTYNIIFRLLNTAFPNFEEVDDAQPTNDDLGVLLEPGDRIVFSDMKLSPLDPDTYNLFFDVINTNYSYGNTTYKGSAALSNATTRGEMSTVSNAANVVDEKVMRDVYKDVVYEESFTATFTVTENTVLKYATTNPTTSTIGDVDDRLLNITTASVYKCTVSNPGAQPASYTWIQDGSIPTFNRSTLDPATYYVFNTIPFVVPWNGGVNKLTQGTFQQLAPVSDDLVFAI
jgi:hypothetical protein